MEQINRHIGKRISEIRHNTPSLRVAMAARITAERLWEIEDGITKPTEDELRGIADALGCRAEDFFAGLSGEVKP